MVGFPNPIVPSQQIDIYTRLREQINRNPSVWNTYAELQQQIYRHPRLWRRDVMSQKPRLSPLAQVKKLAAIIVALGFVLCAWFGVSISHTPRASYPYYDTRKPVPPWSEPMPLKGNLDRGQELK